MDSREMKKSVYIFGAHSRAVTLAVYLTTLDPEISVAAYLYDNDEENPSEIGNVPVVFLNEDSKLKTENSVYLAVRGVYHEKATEHLRQLGFTNIIPVTPKFDTEIRTDFLKKVYKERNRAFVKIDDLKTKTDAADTSACIYEVRSIYDKPLDESIYHKAGYERSIQVGTALTEQRLKECECFDNEGDNISATNRQLCEETALYWIWKHTAEDYIGLVHYRRHFILPGDWKQRMVDNDIDVVLPIPLYVGPSVEENYRFRHVFSDWDVLLEVLKETTNTEKINKVFGDNYYFPCNMFIMRREILEDYCKWLFPMLFEVMKRIGSHEDTYQNRFPAFMAERLLTLFFEMNRDKYQMVYADKNFLG